MADLHDVITSTPFLDDSLAFRTALPLLSTVQLSKSGISRSCAWSVVPCAVAFAAGDGATPAADGVPVVNAMRSDERGALRYVAIDLVSSSKLLLFSLQ